MKEITWSMIEQNQHQWMHDEQSDEEQNQEQWLPLRSYSKGFVKVEDDKFVSKEGFPKDSARLKMEQIKDQHQVSTNSNQWQLVKKEEPIVKKQWGIITTEQIYSKKIDWNRADQVEDFMKKFAMNYGKALIEDLIKRQKIDGEIKTEEQEWVAFDLNLRIFPIDNKKLKLTEFSSFRAVKQQLQEQQSLILKEINIQGLHSVFVENFHEEIKKTSDKQFYTLRCGYEKCPAIIKCSQEKGKKYCQIYLLRNKHNHTITGVPLSQGTLQEPQTIVIDEELHEMFGFNKGVKSQTQNISYRSPEENRALRREKRRTFRAKMKIQEKQKAEIEQQIEGKLDEEYIIQKKRFKKIVHRSRSFQENPSCQIQDIQFRCMQQQLKSRHYIIDAYPDNHLQKFPEFIFITKPDLLNQVSNPTTLRMIVCQNMIRLDPKREKKYNSWSVLFVTVLNSALKPLILAYCVSSKPMIEHFSTVLKLLQKYFPSYRYLIAQYNPDTFDILAKLLSQSRNLLLDQGDVINFLSKYLNQSSNKKILKKLINPLNFQDKMKYMKSLRKKKEVICQDKLKIFEPYIYLPQNNDSREFFGVNIELSAERQMIAKFKDRLKRGQEKYSLRLHLFNLMDGIASNNKLNKAQVRPQTCLQIQKFHKDQQLKILRQSISGPILNIFYLQYGQALQLDYLQSQDGNYIFQDTQSTINQGRCSCNYHQMVGIPCRHLIRVAIENKSSYVGLFDEKWVIDEKFYRLGQEKEQRERTREKIKDKKKGKKNKRQSCDVLD